VARTAGLYLVTVAASAVAFGLLLDLLVPAAEAVLPQLSGHAYAVAEGGWFYQVAAIVLLAVLGFSYWSVGPASDRSTADSGTGKAKEDGDAGGASAHQRHLELLVTGMTCSHCAESVRRALAESTGVRSAEVHLASGRVLVTGDDLNGERLMAAVRELGYTAKLPDNAEHPA